VQAVKKNLAEAFKVAVKEARALRPKPLRRDAPQRLCFAFATV
jgi:hypothetical protein